MATYDVVLKLTNGTTQEVRVEDAESGSEAYWYAQTDLVTGYSVKLVAHRCPHCLDSGIQLEPLDFGDNELRGRRLICICEHGSELLRNRGPDHFTVTADPERELEGTTS